MKTKRKLYTTSLMGAVMALVMAGAYNSAWAQNLNVCALPNSTGALGNLVIPGTVTEPSTGAVFPTVAEINTNTGSITLAANTAGIPFVFFARTRIDTGVTNGIFNFGSITVAAGATLFVTGTNPLVLLATGPVAIDGTVILDGRAGNNGGGGPGGCAPGPGPCGPPENGGGGRAAGGDGGSAGFVTGESGDGISPGVGSGAGPAGGGGGGLQAAGTAGGIGPNIVPPPPITFGQPLAGGAGGSAVPLASLNVNLTAAPLIFPPSGSGGGAGGGDGAIYGDSGGDEGGAGGAGGGTLVICTEDAVTVNGTINGNGGSGPL